MSKKVAILISGYLRSLELNIPSIKEKLIQNFESVDIFLHVTENEINEDVYLNKINYEKKINIIINELKPKVINFSKNLNFSKNKKINNVINLWQKFFLLNETKKTYESVYNEKYDLVIKIRPDLNLMSDDIFEEDIDKSVVYLPIETVLDKKKLKNKDDKFICDIFAYGSSEIMDEYFSIFSELEKLILKYGHVSETLLYHHLKSKKITVVEKPIKYNVILSECNVFAICGDSGSGKTTLGNILKKFFNNSFVLECDRYHKWERNNENWKNFTHLNPDSNFISKMNQDIFDLKIGKSIYQVDYDHSTGKFTDKKTIESSENIIVCGLHSLYTNNENIYNLKIFVDTETDLKTEWKIKRDIEERGHSQNKVIEQINKRSDDYKKYILPQREKSDLILNFYKLENDIALKIYIRKKFKVENIINFLDKNSINFTYNLNESKEFYSIVFEKYQELNYPTLPQLNNFYDYIMYIIFNLKF